MNYDNWKTTNRDDEQLGPAPDETPCRMLLEPAAVPDLPMPRIYATTIVDRAAMTSTELDALWDEYREYWRGHEGHSNKHEDESPTADELFNTWEERR